MSKAHTANTSEIVYVTDKRVACDGGKGALGHPLVYLSLEGKESVECPYCSKTFALKA